MKLEAVRGITVCNLSLEIGGQIDNRNGVKWAFLGTDTAPYAKAFGNEGDLRVWVDFNAELPAANNLKESSMSDGLRRL